MIKKLFFFALLFVGLSAHAQKPLPEYYLIAHAGGGIDGQTYLNCLECIQNALDHKIKYIEIDLIETSDGHIVAGHDWGSFNHLTNRSESADVLTLKEFKERRILNKYEPVSIYDIAVLMEKHQELVLIADKIENYQKLLEQLPFPKRIFVETISFKDYHKALDAGIIYPIFSKRLYRNEDTNLLREDLKRHQIKMMTVGEDFYSAHKEFLRKLRNEGIRIILFSPKMIADSESVQKEVGVYFDLIYSDFCFPDTPCE